MLKNGHWNFGRMGFSNSIPTSFYHDGQKAEAFIALGNKSLKNCIFEVAIVKIHKEGIVLLCK